MPFNKIGTKIPITHSKNSPVPPTGWAPGSEVLITALVSLNDGRASHTTTDDRVARPLCVSLISCNKVKLIRHPEAPVLVTK